MFIYSITNKVNGKKYVGQTKGSIEERWRRHLSHVTGKSNQQIHHAMRKHGVDNFFIETIENVDADMLLEREMYWVQKLDTFNNGYNQTLGGLGSLGLKHTDEAKRKLREANKGKTLSEETKRKMSEATMGQIPWNRGKALSEETKRKISESQKGQIPWIKGKTHTDETKRKMSIASKGNTRWLGKTHTDETKRKMSESKKARPKHPCQHCGKKVDPSNLTRWHNDNCKENPNAA